MRLQLCKQSAASSRRRNWRCSFGCRCWFVLPLGSDCWDHLSAVSAINAKVAVESENVALGINLRHAHETGISQGHRDARVARHQLAERGRVVLDFESDAKQTVLNLLQDQRDADAQARHLMAGVR